MRSLSLFRICFATCITLASILAVIGIPIIGAVLLVPIQKTDYPLLTVVSESMSPTLNIGDMIIVQGGLTSTDIRADYVNGDVIVFYNPHDHRDLIVHRAVEQYMDGATYFRTKGDHNPTVDYWVVLESDIVGKVTGIIPYFGHLILFLETSEGLAMFLLLVVAIIAFASASLILHIKDRNGMKNRSFTKRTQDHPSVKRRPYSCTCERNRQLENREKACVEGFSGSNIE